MKSVISINKDSYDSAILVKHDVAPFIDYPLHFHPEYELVLIEKGFGKRIVGNHIDDFDDGDLVFLSPNLPHIWKCDDQFYDAHSNLTTSCFVVHFRPDSFGTSFFDKPDFADINQLFVQGNYGVLLKGKLKRDITRNIKKLYHIKGTRRIILFLDILFQIYESEEKELLSSPFFENPLPKLDNNRILKIYDYILENFRSKLNLTDLATRMQMTPTSLCRYFKQKIGKSFIEMVNETRVKYACSLLKNTDQTIINICYSSGFNNLSNFNRQFRQITGENPTNYREGLNGG
jgi:AraC-like DNA-binding protein